jgi:hypothetical protein
MSLARRWRAPVLAAAGLAALACGSCRSRGGGAAAAGRDANVATMGSVEVTARLVEVPAGAIFRRKLYDYVTVLRYQVLEVHRGRLPAGTIYVGHYNPFKPRSRAADKHVKGIGGNLRYFRAGQVHRMALEVPIDEHYMGGIVNKYFGRDTGPIYWAVWTNLARP